jgi:hypothetical protein
MLAIQKNCCILAFEVNPWSSRPNPGKHGSGSSARRVRSTRARNQEVACGTAIGLG